MATALSTRRRSERDELNEIESWYRGELLRPAQFPQTQWNPVRIGPTWQLDGAHWLLPEHTLGWQVLAWCGRWLQESRGVPWRFTMEQARFLLHWYALDEAGRFLYRDGVLQRLKGWGKDPLGACLCMAEMLGPVRVVDWDDTGPIGGASETAWVQTAAVSLKQPLALDTSVATPDGWSTIGGLRVGDVVFDSTGAPTRVMRTTEILTGERCYRVSFSDGEELVASADHGWTLERLNGHGDRYETVTVTTEQMRETCIGSKGRRRYRVELVPLDLPDTELALDPYLLGLWLGDGASRDSTIAIDSRIQGEVEALIKPMLSDIETVWWHSIADTNVGTFRIRRRQYVCPRGHDYSVSGFRVNTNGLRQCQLCVRLGKAGRAATPVIPTMREKLRNIGVLSNKHIPANYLRSSHAQRMALLQGLIDSDGGVDSHGRAHFTNANVVLFDHVLELLTTLGFRYSVQPAAGTARRVWFHPGMRPVARLAHKASRQRPYTAWHQSKHRWVTSVTPVDSVPVRCIGINTDDHLFLAGRGMTRTHNTRNTMRLIPGLVTAEAKTKFGIQIGREQVHALGDERFMEAVTSAPASLEGARSTLVLLNETQHWFANNSGHDMADVIERNSTKSFGGAARTLRITNAYDPGEDSVAERDREAWEKAQSGEVVNVGLLYDSLEAPPEAPLTAEAAPSVVTSIRGDSVWLDTETIVKSILDVRNPPSRSRRFWYNQIVAAEDAWADPLEWDACAAPDQVVLPDEKIVAFFDGSKSDDTTGLVGCRVSDGHLFVIGAWAKPPGERGKGWIVPREKVNAAVEAMFSSYRVVGFFADPSDTRDDDGTRFWEPMIDEWHRTYGPRLQVWATQSGDRRHSISWDMRNKQHVEAFALAAGRFLSEMAARRFTHDGNGMLRQHIRNARRRPLSSGAVSFGKEHRESARKVDLAVCAVGASMLRRLLLNTGTGTRQRSGRVW